ncbi:MAG: hypothetical protein FJ145_09365 [Deltaproteobacteria bacterium]|nr:hypothetical protein [Deltaproteobacteria bacterium]
MIDTHFLAELVIILAVTIAIVLVFQKLRLPSIVGFLLAGIIIGPGGLRLIGNASEVEFLAELGVVLLLFIIGVELSLDSLRSVQRRLVVAGILQVALTIAIVALVAVALGVATPVAFFYGFLVAMSSTAIVLRIYNDRREISSMQGQLVTGVLLLQDLCIVPLMLLVPLLAQNGGSSWTDVAWTLLRSIIGLAVIAWTARKLFPWLLHRVALLRNREIFLLFIVLVCLGTAWATASAGLSLALGALIAGLVISESELSHQIVADVLPLRDCFSGIFFISIGMLLNVDLLSRDFTPALLEFLLIVSLKALVIFAIVWWFYRSLRIAMIVALSLAQIGEFSFILAKAGIGHKLLTSVEEQTFLAASILTMVATPFMVQAAQRWSYGMDSLAKGTKQADRGAGTSAVSAHVIVIGYGLNGQNLSRVLKEVAIPYRLLEMNPDVAQQAKREGEPMLFGDGTRPEILEQAGIHSARVVVTAISDREATARIVAQARRMRREIFIIVRTRYVTEIESLYRLGANQVIPEEFETSVEIFARVLQEFHIPRNVISLQVDLIRREHYGTLRGQRLEGRQLDELNRFLVGATSDILSVQEGSAAAGKSIAEVDLPGRCGVNLVAIVRKGKSFVSVAPEFTLAAGDRLVLIGDHRALDDAAGLVNPQPT